jgi:hypothetical protein
MSTPDSALQQALQLHHEPGLLFVMQGRPLPGDMARVLRIVGDESNALENAKALGVNAADLQQLSANYLRAVCLHAGSEPLRCLGLNDAHDLRLAKEHHRLLMKWLHPDRNADQHVFAERVNQAWTQLKTGRFSARVPVANVWQVVEPVAVPASNSRFPLFLWLLFAAALGLLALSVLWPEQEIYGTDMPDARTSTVQSETSLMADVVEPERLSLPEVDWNSEESLEPAPIPAAQAPAIIPSSAKVPSPVKQAHAESASATRLLPNSAPKPIASVAIEKKPLVRMPETPSSTSEFKAVSAGVAVPVPQVTASASGPSQGEALQVLQAFSRHYQAGQLEPFMALFSTDAQNDRGGRSAIAEDYGRLFQSSRRRSLDLSRLQWQPQSFGWRLSARYLAKVQRDNDLLPVKNKGTIELDFAEEGGRIRVRRIALK